MKKNHRRGDEKRQDRKKGFNGGVENVKAEARKGRRAADRAAMAKLRVIGYDPEDADVVFHTKNIHISDIWNWD
jgi:hypothetical protein